MWFLCDFSNVPKLCENTLKRRVLAEFFKYLQKFMNSPKTQKSIQGYRVLVTLGAFVLVVAGLRSAAPLLVPFLFAVFLAVLGTPQITWLKSKGVPSSLAVLLVALAIISVSVGFGILLVSSANQFTNKIPEYRVALIESVNSFRQWIDMRLGILGVRGGGELIVQYLQPTAFMDSFGSFLNIVAQTLSKTFLVFILMIFMLVEATDFQLKARIALPKGTDTSRFEKTAFDVQRYLAIKTVTSLMTGMLVLLWTFFMGVDFPFLWGLLAFILNYVPFIGSIIASIPALVLTVVLAGPSSGIFLGIGYLVINIGISNFIEPVFMGRRLGLSPLIVLLSLTFWGWVWGPAGALMSVPLTMILKILLEHSEEFSWIAVLMDTKPRPRLSDALDRLARTRTKGGSE